MRRVRTIYGDTVPHLLYRETGRADDVAEEELWRLNPGLAEYGVTLPSGLWVVLPELVDQPVASAPVTAWD